MIEKLTYLHTNIVAILEKIKRKSKSKEIRIKLREFLYDPEMLSKYHLRRMRDKNTKNTVIN